MDVIMLGRRLRVARALRELSCRQLGALVGVHNATISRYECGLIAKPRLPVLICIADVLEVSLSWLLSGDGLVTRCPSECAWVNDQLSRFAAVPLRYRRIG